MISDQDHSSNVYIDHFTTITNNYITLSMPTLMIVCYLCAILTLIYDDYQVHQIKLFIQHSAHKLPPNDN